MATSAAFTNESRFITNLRNVELLNNRAMGTSVNYGSLKPRKTVSLDRNILPPSSPGLGSRIKQFFKSTIYKPHGKTTIPPSNHQLSGRTGSLKPRPHSSYVPPGASTTGDKDSGQARGPKWKKWTLFKGSSTRDCHLNATPTSGNRPQGNDSSPLKSSLKISKKNTNKLHEQKDKPKLVTPHRVSFASSKSASDQEKSDTASQASSSGGRKDRRSECERSGNTSSTARKADRGRSVSAPVKSRANKAKPSVGEVEGVFIRHRSASPYRRRERHLQLRNSGDSSHARIDSCSKGDTHAATTTNNALSPGDRDISAMDKTTARRLGKTQIGALGHNSSKTLKTHSHQIPNKTVAKCLAPHKNNVGKLDKVDNKIMIGTSCVKSSFVCTVTPVNKNMKQKGLHGLQVPKGTTSHPNQRTKKSEKNLSKNKPERNNKKDCVMNTFGQPRNPVPNTKRNCNITQRARMVASNSDYMDITNNSRETVRTLHIEPQERPKSKVSSLIYEYESFLADHAAKNGYSHHYFDLDIGSCGLLNGTNKGSVLDPPSVRSPCAEYQAMMARSLAPDSWYEALLPCSGLDSRLPTDTATSWTATDTGIPTPPLDHPPAQAGTLTVGDHVHTRQCPSEWSSQHLRSGTPNHTNVMSHSLMAAAPYPEMSLDPFLVTDPCDASSAGLPPRMHASCYDGLLNNNYDWNDMKDKKVATLMSTSCHSQQSYSLTNCERSEVQLCAPAAEPWVDNLMSCSLLPQLPEESKQEGWQELTLEELGDNILDIEVAEDIQVMYTARECEESVDWMTVNDQWQVVVIKDASTNVNWDALPGRHHRTPLHCHLSSVLQARNRDISVRDNLTNSSTPDRDYCRISYQADVTVKTQHCFGAHGYCEDTVQNIACQDVNEIKANPLKSVLPIGSTINITYKAKMKQLILPQISAATKSSYQKVKAIHRPSVPKLQPREKKLKRRPTISSHYIDTDSDNYSTPHKPRYPPRSRYKASQSEAGSQTSSGNRPARYRRRLPRSSRRLIYCRKDFGVTDSNLSDCEDSDFDGCTLPIRPVPNIEESKKKPWSIASQTSCIEGKDNAKSGIPSLTNKNSDNCKLAIEKDTHRGHDIDEDDDLDSQLSNVISNFSSDEIDCSSSCEDNFAVDENVGTQTISKTSCGVNNINPIEPGPSSSDLLSQSQVQLRNHGHKPHRPRSDGTLPSEDSSTASWKEPRRTVSARSWINSRLPFSPRLSKEALHAAGCVPHTNQALEIDSKKPSNFLTASNFKPTDGQSLSDESGCNVLKSNQLLGNKASLSDESEDCEEKHSSVSKLPYRSRSYSAGSAGHMKYKQADRCFLPTSRIPRSSRIKSKSASPPSCPPGPAGTSKCQGAGPQPIARSKIPAKLKVGQMKTLVSGAGIWGMAK